MILAYDLLLAAAQAIQRVDAHQWGDSEESGSVVWRDLSRGARDKYLDQARAAVTAVLDTIVASDDTRRSGLYPMDFEALAQLVGEVAL